MKVVLVVMKSVECVGLSGLYCAPWLRRIRSRLGLGSLNRPQSIRQVGFLKIPPMTPFLGPPQVGFLDEALPVGDRAPNFVRGPPRGKKKKEGKKKGGDFQEFYLCFSGGPRAALAWAPACSFLVPASQLQPPLVY